MAVSIVERDFIPESFLSDLDELRRRLDVVERLLISTSAADARYARAEFSVANVSSPPTEAELDTAFGVAATLGKNFIGIVDDAGAGTTLWVCIPRNDGWHYEQLTKAV